MFLGKEWHLSQCLKTISKYPKVTYDHLLRSHRYCTLLTSISISVQHKKMIMSFNWCNNITYLVRIILALVFYNQKCSSMYGLKHFCKRTKTQLLSLFDDLPISQQQLHSHIYQTKNAFNTILNAMCNQPYYVNDSSVSSFIVKNVYMLICNMVYSTDPFFDPLQR